ncbi:AraC family transcriptional regulator [Demequina sp. NBRC 110054]|uniref:AraC family transcriptional regulator n=1 Tax=Demequina sp. NBRC 110054 TaxID=1570343 RepID=UPI000A06490B|nr:AraC family transcriptional regulator [Demequina sp. NBRC 110054]
MRTSTNPPPPGADVVDSALAALSLEGTLYCRSILTSPWGIEIPAMPGTMSFLFVITGDALLDVDGEDPVALRAGSLTLIPHGRPHRFTSEPGVPTVPLASLEVERVSERYEVTRAGGGGKIAEAMYGVVEVGHLAAARLVSQLPGVVTFDAMTDDMSEWMQSTMRLIAAEAGHLGLGGETLITRLADVLVIQGIRTWWAQSAETGSGWLRALHDPQVSKAIGAVAREPSRPWTVDSLARTCLMSRSAFAERFTTLVGETPMRYVTRWRLDAARHELSAGDATVAVVARSSGYASEAAFSRAFTREFGVTPGGARSRTVAP